jgi:hypothetical protein
MTGGVERSIAGSHSSISSVRRVKLDGHRSLICGVDPSAVRANLVWPRIERRTSWARKCDNGECARCRGKPSNMSTATNHSATRTPEPVRFPM